MNTVPPVIRKELRRLVLRERRWHELHAEWAVYAREFALRNLDALLTTKR